MEEKLKAEEEEKRKRDQEKLRKETRSLKDKGERLDKKEQEAMDEMQTADELLSEGTSKLQAALSSGSKLIHKVQKLHVSLLKRSNQIRQRQRGSLK